MRVGALPEAGGVRFRLWAPEARSVQLHLRRGGGQTSILDLARCVENRESPPATVWELLVAGAAPGDRYAYSLDGREPLPDPASRFLPDGVHGWSEVVDPDAFVWTDAAWDGLDPRRAVIYELHVGTFTPSGTFCAAAERLPFLRDLGVTVVELMPVADFPGARNWGYDGVALYAPSRAYGRPDDLRAFIDAAHACGLAVLIDVVYNHLGPEGAYLPTFAPQFLTSAHLTPWGDAVNLDAPGSDGVRGLLIDNALHWIREYHADGVRLDAIHALIDDTSHPFVSQLAAVVQASGPWRRLVYAEDSRNLAFVVQDRACGGWGLDGIWADDFHHIIRRMLAGDDRGYYVDYDGTTEELADTLRHGWLYRGQVSRHTGAPRGTSASGVAMRKAIVCLQNHDQVGNRAIGDRLHHTIDAASWRAAIAILLTAPMTPLLFMGQEWAVFTPFQFFTDFEPELGRRVVDGRRDEFRGFPEFATPDAARRIPDPQADSTFEQSRLQWGERDTAPHAAVLALHRALLALRADNPALQGSDACSCEARALDDGAVMFVREGAGRRFLVVARLGGVGPVQVPELSAAAWHLVLDTEEPRFALDPTPAHVDRLAGTIGFARPGALVFQRTGSVVA